jgi:FlaG/FlaF family flagellin (archaellin)
LSALRTKIGKNLGRKAISPVISTLLIISIVVVASIVTYAWVTNYVNVTTSRIGGAIQIQSVFAHSDSLFLFVQNVGQGPVTFLESNCVYIDGELRNCEIGGDNPLEQGETTTLAINDFIFPQNGHIDIKVVTKSGTFTQANERLTRSLPNVEPLPDGAFTDDFESGNLDKWSVQSPEWENDALLRVSSDAAYQGTWGLRISNINEPHDDAFILKWVPQESFLHGSTRVRFSQDLALGGEITGLINFNTWSSSVGCGLIRWSNGSYSWEIYSRPANVILYSTVFTLVPGQWYKLDFASLASTTSNGNMTLWVDSSKKALISDIRTSDDPTNWIAFAIEADNFYYNSMAETIDFDNAVFANVRLTP